jgi:hypothetical protein
VKVCHKGKRTLRISASALQAHLDHGDTLGRCDRDDDGKKHGRRDRDDDDRKHGKGRDDRDHGRPSWARR